MKILINTAVITIVLVIQGGFVNANDMQDVYDKYDSCVIELNMGNELTDDCKEILAIIERENNKIVEDLDDSSLSDSNTNNLNNENEKGRGRSVRERIKSSSDRRDEMNKATSLEGRNIQRGYNPNKAKSLNERINESNNKERIITKPSPFKIERP